MIDAGCTFQTLINLTRKGIGSFEELACIPGSIGGLIYQNASFNNVSVNDIIITVLCLDKDGNLVYLNKEDLKYGYRNSIFKNKEYLILSGIFKCNKNGDINKIYNYLNYKKKVQPLNTKNAGSIFINKDQSAWKIIREIGADKFKINDACVSSKHSNFLVNLNNASFNDMYELIIKIQKKARVNGYELDLEIEIIN
jgi:UDP-N-acetylmuramate dehydrogenase